ncbi:hypothetical protein NFI96_017789, partial [Prochilodus magdalenae]
KFNVTSEKKKIVFAESDTGSDVSAGIESRSSSWGQLSLQTGGTVTIPCHYDMKYIHHKKYWCFDAKHAFNYCKIQAYGNNTKNRVTVSDYPAQSLFTVTMRDLRSADTGTYWCVVEIGGLMEPDVKEQMKITVKSDPDLSVVETSVSGQEEGSVSVQCLYSAGYKNEQKQWCRFKDWRCYTVGRTNTSQNSAVQVSDDGRRSFSVEMRGLQKTDAGWYWCKTGDLQVPVHLSVSDAPPVLPVKYWIKRSTMKTVKPALICEEHKAPVVDLPILVFCGKCQSSSMELARTGQAAIVTEPPTPQKRKKQEKLQLIHHKNRSNMDCPLMFILLMLSIESWSSSCRQLSLQTGGLVTIPCHYDMKYIHHKKYWCFDAKAAFNYCKIQAYGNNTNDRVTVTDYPAQSLFTVTMRDLWSGDTGMYWCVVEIGGLMEPDVKEQMEITVKSDPDLSVVNSSVSGQEEGNVSVQCLYSAGYKNEQKQWCRSKDWRCHTVGRTSTSQNSAVQISDDGRRSFIVEMSGLQKSDAGWYWCKAGDLQVPVHLSVSDAPAGTLTNTFTWFHELYK